MAQYVIPSDGPAASPRTLQHPANNGESVGRLESQL